MEKILITGGRVMDPANHLDTVADVLLADDEVVKIGPNLESRRRGGSMRRARSSAPA